MPCQHYWWRDSWDFIAGLLLSGLSNLDFSFWWLGNQFGLRLVNNSYFRNDEFYTNYIICEASVASDPADGCGLRWVGGRWCGDRARTFNTYSLHTNSTLFLISSDDSLCYLQMKVKEDEDDTAGYSLYYNGFHKRNSAMAEGIYIFPLSIQWCFQDILNDQQDLYFAELWGLGQ